MNIKEAYSTIGVAESASDDELKAKYKDLAKKYHPDVCKDQPDKFKKINEAYQTIQDYKTNPGKYQPHSSPFGRQNVYGNINFEDIFFNMDGMGGQHQQSKTVDIPPPTIDIKISFKDSVLGVDQSVKYKKFIKCDTCNGNGLEFLPNGCKSCNGFGRIVSNNKGMIFTRTCSKCYGRNIKQNQCIPCHGKGLIEKENTGTVQIPPGTLNNSTLRLQGAGHYAGNSFFGDAYGHAYLHINVETDPDLILVGHDVVAHLKLSLLDAISGCQREVRTIHGPSAVNVLPMSRNKDEISLAGFGVKHTNGAQRVILDVSYPDDTKSLIEYLKGS